MTSLELRLLALGHELELPVDPDLTAAVLEQLSPSGKRRFPWRRAGALAFALVAIAFATAFAVPHARTAILRFFHVGGATVVRVETLPPAVERNEAGGLGRAMSLHAAERAVGFHILLPPYKCCGPGRVYILDDSMATVVVRAGGNHRAMLSEFRSFGPPSLKKLVSGQTRVEPAQVNGREALWIEGGSHTLRYFDRGLGVQELTVRIHGNVLIWVRGGLTLRLEGNLTKDDALSVARSTR